MNLLPGVEKLALKVGNIPIITRVLDTARALKPRKIHVVVAPTAPAVRELLAPDIEVIVQPEPIGTADAAMRVVAEKLPPKGSVLFLPGSAPLISFHTLMPMTRVEHLAVLCSNLEEDFDVGSGKEFLVWDDSGETLQDIVQEDPENWPGDIEIEETGKISPEMVYADIIAAPIEWLKIRLPNAIEQAQQEGKSAELSRLVKLAHEDDMPIENHWTDKPLEWRDIGTFVDLEIVERQINANTVRDLQLSGTRMADSSTVQVRGELKCAKGVEIDANTIFDGKVVLGKNVRIGTNCVVKDSSLGDNTVLEPFSHIEGCTSGAGCRIGPFARIRPDTRLGDGAKIGNFVETKASVIGDGAKAGHLSYLGDSEIGARTNVGAGTITCNYDGEEKHRTKIGDEAFVGSGVQIVAPVTIGDGAYIAAGSTITEDVASGKLAIARARQVEKKPKARKKKGKS